MNFLALCRRTASEAGLSGAINNVTNVQGEFARLVGWVREAHNQIQTERDWPWLWAQTGQVLAPGQQTYIPSDWGIRVRRWQRDSLRVGGQRIPLLSYESGRHEPDGARQPGYVVELPDKRLHFSHEPDAPYLFTADYIREPAALVQTEDEPTMPDEFHMVIVWQAAIFVADFEETVTLRQTAQLKRDEIRARMLRDYFPQQLAGAPLA